MSPSKPTYFHSAAQLGLETLTRLTSGSNIQYFIYCTQIITISTTVRVHRITPEGEDVTEDCMVAWVGSGSGPGRVRSRSGSGPGRVWGGSGAGLGRVRSGSVTGPWRILGGSVRPSTTSVYVSAIGLTHDCALRCYIMCK